jgi:hypothetical protein
MKAPRSTAASLRRASSTGWAIQLPLLADPETAVSKLHWGITTVTREIRKLGVQWKTYRE